VLQASLGKHVMLLHLFVISNTAHSRIRSLQEKQKCEQQLQQQQQRQ
jgi:hypothetical protein